MWRCSRDMPCEGCTVQFSVFRRRRACPECARAFCAACLRRGGGLCASCRVLCARPLLRHSIAHLKPRDLQCFLQRQNVSTRGCVEKDELLDLCVLHVNSGAYRRRGVAGAGAGAAAGAGGAGGAFSVLKGFTNNINELINNAFDLRTMPHAQPAPPPPARAHTDNGNCFNTAHAHTSAARAPSPPRARPRAPQPYSSGGGGGGAGAGPPPAPAPPPAAPAAAAASPDEPRVESADCFEVEDVQGWDCDWELVRRPAAPLPNDSEVLLTVNEGSSQPAPASPPAAPPQPPAREREQGTPQRAASELDLRSPPDHDSDTASLKDEPAMDIDNSAAWRVPKLEELESEAALAALSARQLKALLGSNRVSYRGALERAELLRRAAALWRDHRRARARGLEELPLEECCKICMAAPLECVLLECGHVAACTRCAVQLAECPICRQYVVRAVRFFRS